MRMRWLGLMLLVACADKEKSASEGGGVGADSPVTDSGELIDDTGTEDTLCPEDEDVFETHVWTPVLGSYCVACHVADGPASGTAMVFEPDDMLHNLRAATAVADRLLDKPTGMHASGHGGGTLVLPDSEAWHALEFWVGWSQGECDVPSTDCEDVPTPRRLWRLDHDQYQATVEDLLGISTDYGQSLAADTQVDGFPNDADALLVSGLLADQYRGAAEDLAGVVDIAAMLTCTPEEGAITQCAATFIEDFGLRAFRRPMTPEELTVYLELWAEVATDDGFFEGLRWVVAGMLQSPHFLYRSELGTPDGEGLYTLTDWEIASELSYLLWGTMPDAALFEAAAAGELRTADQIAAQVERMVTDDRALQQAASFVEIWLQLDRLSTVSRTGLSSVLQSAMAEQTEETVKALARDGATLSDLMLGTSTWMPDALADHYGVDGGGWVEQDGESYGGLLTHGSLLTVYALAEGSSPVHRGVAVRERMLCEELPPPPANLDTSPPATDAAGTTREKYALHSSLPACASCHELIDPIGFGFEHYDHLGRWRDDEDGAPIDATGHVDGEDFEGALDLGALLLDDPRFRSCYVRTWRRWGTGAEACADDPGDVGVMTPLLDIPARVSFTTRVGEASEGETLAVGSRMSADEQAAVVEAVGEILPGGATAGVEFTLVETSTWPGGFCSDGAVTNTTGESVVWEARAEVAGEITSIWNAEYTIDGDEHVFTGVSWNAELAAFGSTTFGFCGTR